MNVPIQGQRPQPRWGCNFGSDHSQGSSCLATLGWRSQSRWDCLPRDRARFRLQLRWRNFNRAETARWGAMSSSRRPLDERRERSFIAGDRTRSRRARESAPYLLSITDVIPLQWSCGNFRIASYELPTTPTGLWPPAQSCEERATLGNVGAEITTPTGLRPWGNPVINPKRISRQRPKLVLIQSFGDVPPAVCGH